ncbi:MAG: folylpolyglutamate synthase/dihydrofolate synthase family protein [Myxococcota bacterium]
MAWSAAYIQTLRSLLGHRPTSSKWGLGRTRELLQRLGLPHKRMRLLQVAGTNGKGSVCAMLDAMLRQAGMVTGCFTSPHLSCVRERIRVNGQMVPEAAFCALHDHVEQAARGMEDSPTFFERLFAMALLHFARAGVQAVVLEVGLGGRLDATSAVTPAACGITTIALDHTRLLGRTLSAVAREKAGICKPGVPVVVAPQPPEALAAVTRHADMAGSPLVRVGREIRVMHRDGRITVSGGNRVLLPRTHLALKGEHQWNNAAVAVGMLQQADLALDPRTRRRGMEQTRWPGRYEWIHGHTCPVLLDGAHNPNGLIQLARCLKEDPKLQALPLLAVVGLSQGHDEIGFARAWRAHMPPTHAVYTTQTASGPFTRALNACTTAKLLRQAGVRRVTPVARVAEALHHARIQARRQGGCILVTGSLYVVGRARSLLARAPTDPSVTPAATPSPAHR